MVVAATGTAAVDTAADETAPVPATAATALVLLSDFPPPSSRRAAAASTQETGAAAGAPEPPPKSTDNTDAAETPDAETVGTVGATTRAEAATSDTAATDGTAVGATSTELGVAAAAATAGDFVADSDSAAALFTELVAVRSTDAAELGRVLRCLPTRLADESFVLVRDSAPALDAAESTTLRCRVF